MRKAVAVIDIGMTNKKISLWDEKLKNPRIPKRGDLTWFPYPY